MAPTRFTAMRWRVTTAVVLSTLLAACGKDNPTAESVPTIKDPTVSLSALETGNGPGKCLEADNVDAGFAGSPLECTSNDIDIAEVRITEYSINGATPVTYTPGSRISCAPGDIIKVKTTAVIRNNAQDRYDIGLWVNPTQGGDARFGTGAQACQHYNLTVNTPGVANTDGDACGDMAAAQGNKATTTDLDLDVIEFKCEDPDKDGTVDLNACTAWQNSANRTCPVAGVAAGLNFRYGTTPENKAKCNCNDFALPIDVKSVIRVKKVTDPAGDGTKFTFTPSGTGWTTPFDLTGASLPAQSPPLSNGTYQIAEAVTAGWDFVSASCVDTATGASKASTVTGTTLSVAVTNGEDVTCTFTNRKRASLTIVKVADPKDAQDFTFSTTGTGLSTFTLDDDGDPAADKSNTVTFTNLVPGAYAVTEAAVPGWTQSSISCSNGVAQTVPTANVTLAAGQSVTCTFTNTKNGKLTIVKSASPADGTDFAFTGTGSGVSGFSLDVDADATLSNQQVFTFTPAQFGAKTITESAPPAGWSLTNLVCSPTVTTNIATRTVSLTIGAGSDITCTYTNTKAASVTITKVTKPAAAAGTSFTFTTTGSGWPTTAFLLDTDGATSTSNSALIAITDFTGTKTVTESALAGWTLESVACTKNGTKFDASGAVASFSVAAGDVVACTYTNTKDATITIVKDADPNAADDFTFTPAGPGVGTTAFLLDDDADATLSNSRVFTIKGTDIGGTKTFTESAATGWALTAIDCTPAGGAASLTNVGSSKVDVTVVPGSSITCTFVNKRLGSITIVKDAQPNDAQDFSFTTTGTGLSAFSLDDDADATLSNSKTFSNLQPGTYTIEENATPGWAFTALSCVGGGSTSGAKATINLAIGQNVSCTYTNAKLPTLTLRKQVIGSGTGTFGFTLTGTDAPSSATISPAANSTAPAANVNGIVIKPGAYSISETSIPAGWMLNNYGCTVNGTPIGTASGTTVSFNAAYNQNIICTFTNAQMDGSVTRTQGFWSTHTAITTIVWNGGTLPNGDAVPGVPLADRQLCTDSPDPLLVAKPLLIPEVFGGFWANIAKTTTNTQRGELDKFRMQMLQQYLAAVLNVYAFNTPLPSGYSLAGARAAYCGTDVTAINNYKSVLAGYNEKYDAGTFTPGTSATAQLSRSTADNAFWNTTYRKFGAP